MPRIIEDPTLADIIAAVQIMHIEPNDTLVVRCAAPLSAQQAAQIRGQLEGKIPHGVPVLVLDADASLEIMRPTTDA